MISEAAHRWIRNSPLWIYRLLTWAVLAAGLLFAAVILVLRYWILPDIAAYREDIAQRLSQATQQRITIGSISANWDGLRPQLGLTQVVVHDAAGRPALELPRVDATLSWRSAALLQVNFHSLDIFRPVLTVRRDSQGDITVAGIAMNMNRQDSGGFSRWILGQRDIEIHGARLIWTDELRAAPDLVLEQLQLRIVNSGRRHRVGLRATPPAALASPLDVRGDLRGEDFQELAESLTGQLFVQLDHVDIAAWRQWVDFPVHFPHGTGALRAWLTFARNELSAITADVQLQDVRAKLGAELPELDMLQLGGRFSWKQAGDGFEVATRKLSFTTGDGLTLQPVDVTARLFAGRSGAYARGEVHANALELVPLAKLADRLPLDAAFRKLLTDHAPSGSVYDVSVRWADAGAPAMTYAVRGRFQELALRAHGAFPGFSGFSGNIDGTEKGGTLHVVTQKAQLDMQGLFRERLKFDSLSGQMAWTRAAVETELRFSNFAFANADLAGTLFGSYRVTANGPGIADLTGKLTHGVARRTTDYLPLTVAAGARPWLEQAFLGGYSKDVRFRLKGDLQKFPYTDERDGLFEVAVKVNGATVNYGEGWPRITDIDGDVQFRGKRMDIHARQARIGEARLVNVRAQIADLTDSNRVLQINGEAAGDTSAFLGFIAQSPVSQMIDGFTEGMQAQGQGRLSLRLTLPLSTVDKSKVKGNYQFINNRLIADAAMPAIESINGRLEFNESSVQVPNATAVFLGGPLTVSAGSQRDAAVSIRFNGKINADAVRRAGGVEWIRHMRGTTDWRGSLTLRQKSFDFVVDSSLQGLAVNLPAPFIKTAGETLPLRIERRSSGPQQERLTATVGSVVNAVLYRRSTAQGSVVERGAIRFGEGAAPEPERTGVAISGAIRILDLDEWLTVLGGGGSASGISVSTVDLRIGEVDFFDRRFAKVAVKAAMRDGALQANVQGRDIDGVVTWRGQGKGQLTARLRKLALPVKEARGSLPPPETASPDLPALDIIIDEFHLVDRLLGKLEVQATPQQRDWRIERLRLITGEAVLNVDGIWQSWLTQPRTDVNVRLDVNDVGKFLTRFGYPEGVRRGTAKLEGTLAWAGSPQRIDYPTLTGNFALDAAKGQFVKLEPGMGKLLGMLSLQSLPRRITLDFRDIFSEGFAFDEILAAIKVAKGVASSDNLRIVGPAARINMSGQVDLARETQVLRVKVNPQISDTVSVAGALIGGPIAGLAAFIAQKLLKDPFDQITAYEYDVTGTWTDPVVVKVKHQPVASQEPKL